MLTNLQFARQAAYIAKNCAAWSGDSLTLDELANEPISQEALSRFVAYIRDRLDDLERRARDA